MLLMVYPDAGSLRAAAERHRPGGGSGDAIGVWQESRWHADADAYPDGVPDSAWSWPHGGYFGVMRLCPDSLNMYVVMHECLHAALSLARRQCWEATGESGRFPDLSDMENEEWLIHLHGEITDRVTGALGWPSIGGPR